MDYVIRPATREELDISLEWAVKEGWNPGLHDAGAFYSPSPESPDSVGDEWLKESYPPKPCATACRPKLQRWRKEDRLRRVTDWKPQLLSHGGCHIFRIRLNKRE